MPVHIIHKDGVYNFYDTRSDGAWFESGLTLDQLTEFYSQEYGHSGSKDLEFRLQRAHERGTSSFIDNSLEDCVRLNRAGPREQRMKVDDFIAKFLTIVEDDGVTE